MSDIYILYTSFSFHTFAQDTISLATEIVITNYLLLYFDIRNLHFQLFNNLDYNNSDQH